MKANQATGAETPQEYLDDYIARSKKAGVDTETEEFKQFAKAALERMELMQKYGYLEKYVKVVTTSCGTSISAATTPLIDNPTAETWTK